jgi:hypothetical protein
VRRDLNADPEAPGTTTLNRRLGSSMSPYDCRITQPSILPSSYLEVEMRSSKKMLWRFASPRFATLIS